MVTHDGEVADAAPAPKELEDGGQATVDELLELNLGTEEDPRSIFVSALLTAEEKQQYRDFHLEHRD